MQFDIMDSGPGPFYNYVLVQKDDKGNIMQSLTIGNLRDLHAFRDQIYQVFDRIGVK